MSEAKLAYVFPGQGSQFVGMMSELADHPVAKELFSKAADVLHYDLWSMVQNGPEEELNQTQHTQPALLVASYVVWKILQEAGSAKPDMLAGHSLGEYTALLCANALNFQDAVKLVAARGDFMQQAVANTKGAMAAIIGLTDEDVSNVCNNAVRDNEVLSPANFNSIGQVVIAGHKEAVERAIVLAKEQGAKMAIMIPVSVPSHCELMKSAAVQLKNLLDQIEFRVPEITVISNVDVLPYTSEAEIRDGLVRQLYMPVRWVETIEYFAKQGIAEITECGPGKVLTGLNKRINKDLLLRTSQQVLIGS